MTVTTKPARPDIEHDEGAVDALRARLDELPAELVAALKASDADRAIAFAASSTSCRYESSAPRSLC